MTVVVLALLAGCVLCAEAALPPVSQFDVQDYNLATSSNPWSQPPSHHHRLYLDVYNVTDVFDSETGGTAGFTDQTVLADTLRPTLTVLWDERFRIQAGVMAEKMYGDPVGFGSVDPWIQLLWQPIQPLSVVLGNLDTPHYFLPALFYPTNYFTRENHETGVQVILKKPAWYDDFYYNYRLRDTPEHNEKFDLGFVHRHDWRFLNFNYQAHWIHQGGELHPHNVFTRNDVSQAGGLGVQFHPMNSLLVGAQYHYLHSHLRQDADLSPLLIPSTDGHGHLYQAYVRWSRLKVLYGDWRGHHFAHEGGDPMFILPILDMVTVRWDVLLSRDFNLFAETTAYFVGDNDQGYSRDAKAAFHIQASWQFSIPIMEWTSPAASPEGSPLPARWDYGL